MTSINNGCIYLSNDVMSLLIKVDTYGKLELLHLGRTVDMDDAEALTVNPGTGWGSAVLYEAEDNRSCLDRLPLFYGESGRGDYRESAIELLKGGIPFTPDFIFESAEELEEDPETMSGLPYAKEALSRIKITMKSKAGNLKLMHYISLFETAISFRTVLENNGEPVCLAKLASFAVDIPGWFDMHTFGGGWIAEGHRQVASIGQARVVNSSNFGFSSATRNSGVIITKRNVSENHGEAFGINIVYSGNHYTSAQKSPQDLTRIVCGINPEDFFKKLGTGDLFETPEAVISYSGNGMNGMMENMHEFVLGHVVPKYWANRERPVVYNSWEGCMFDFTEKKILSLAKKAAALGCETFVLDDGWFGERNSDKAGLGDYEINTKKLPGGISKLAEKIRAMGLEFGLWFEPEGVNPDSSLYRKHPDWAIHQEGLNDVYGRNQLLLDLRIPEVRDYIVSNVGKIIDEAGLSFVKWDMNRESVLRGAEAHEYILGLYDVLRRIFEPRPKVLLESCSSGGNRFDLGMLCFGPQIWTSDDTDPVERIDIQDGMYYLYPQSCVSAHVSASPHAQTLRATPLSTRFNVSVFGVLGYELDLAYLAPVEEKEIKEQIEYYKRHRKTFQFGKLRRRYLHDDALTWHVSGENEWIVGLFHRLVHAAPPYEYLKIRLPEGRYIVKSKAQALRVGNFGTLLKHVTPVAVNPEGMVVNIANKNYRMQDAVFEAECSNKALDAGIPVMNSFLGTGYSDKMRMQSDFGSNLFTIYRKED